MSRRFYQAFSLSAAALLSACGGLPQTQVNVPLADAPGAAPQNVEHLKNNKSFAYTGAAQTFIVPAGVRRLTVVARGGRGSGTFYPPSYAPGGFPGRVYSVIRVRPGEKLYVFVGASGDNGGWNGGGAGGTAGYGGGTGNRGGGASDVRVGGDKLKNRIIVAAGGGGSGSAFSYCYAPGGDGGGLSGKPGGGDGYSNSGGGGGGGTQSKGGSGGSGGLGDKRRQNGQPGDDAALGRGGNGGNGGPGNNSYAYGLPGGGGGGGYYGGGGGGGSSAGGTDHYENSQGGGGGGGSSYVEPSAIKFRMWPGFKAEGDGLVTFSWN